MYSKPVSPQPVGGVLDDGFSLYRHSIKEAFPFAFAAAAAAGGIDRLLTDWLLTTADGELAWLAAASSLVVSVVSVPLFVPVVATIDAIRHGRRVSAGDALRLGLRRFFPVLGAAAAYAAMLVVGTLLFVVPAVYLAVAFVFSLLAASVEHKGVRDSLRYSFDVVSGRWWRTAISLTVGTVVLYVLVGFVVAAVLAYHGGALIVDGQVRFPWHVDVIVLPVAAGALMPLLYALLMAIYADAKLRHEGADIAARIAAAKA